MKLAIVFAAVLAVSAAQFNGFGNPPRAVPRPTPPPKPAGSRVASSDQLANVISYVNDIRPDGSFDTAYETDNGISSQAQGTPRDFGGNPPIVPVVIQGSYSYYGDDGQQYTIKYIADENGFQPTGDSIPTSPPIPEAILRSLAYLEKNQKK